MTRTLEAEDLTYLAGGRPLVDGVTFSAGNGEVIAVIGPNGAGKSTLLALLAGDLRAARGEARLMGRPPRSWPARRLARLRAVLPQTSATEFPFTSRQVVEMGCSAWAGRGRETRERMREAVERALDAADAGGLADAPVTELSVGERARVALARVLAQDAQVLMLDEPTAALDIRHQHTVMRVAREQAAAGRLVVAVLHDLNLAAGYADRIVLMAGGRLRALGTPAEVLTGDLLGGAYRHPIEVTPDPRGRPLVRPALLSHPTEEVTA
jgi:iron complex transport system ATP-binding protein